MKNVRLERINSELQIAIANIINNDLRDPQINAMVSVSDVQITPDLANAKVFISSFGATPIDEVVLRLKGAGGFIRKELSKKVKLRITPYLDFIKDTSMEYSSKIDSILKDITYATDSDSEND